MTPAQSATALAERFGATVRDVAHFRGETSVVVERTAIVEVCRFCRHDLCYDMLSDITATDWLDRDPRFDVVYHLNSMQTWNRLRLKVQANDGEPVPTVIPIWPAANWAEREVTDLFGIPFAGHPDPRRLLLPEGWVGHPLRKDYPQTQITLPRPLADKSAE